MLAVIAGALVLLLVIDAVRAFRGGAFPAALALAGVAAIFGGGLANWLFSLQGFVILTEADAIPLQATAHLQELEAGPLSDPEELAAMLQLEKLELRPAAGGFVPASVLRVLRSEDNAKLTLTPADAGRVGTLRFHQGAFGFAPRIVITKDDRTVFDRQVPFATNVHDERKLGFSGTFTIARERLLVRSAIDLSSLDDRMRGHATLGVSVSKDGRELGRGELKPGHFADLADGYRIGYAGMKRWSEIDIARRNYPEPMLAGLFLIVWGGVAAALRRLR